MADRRPPVHAPRQARSRETERAIADAISELLRRKSFADIAVAEIAAAANVSVGGLYARFSSKDALLEMVQLNILEAFAAIAAEKLDAARFEGKGLSSITHAYVELMVTHFRVYRTEILQILRYTRPNSDTELQLRTFNMAVHDRMRALLMERREELAGDDIARTINLGLFIAGAACRDAVLTRNLSVYPIEVSDEALTDEVARAFYAYLTHPVAAR